MNRCLLQGCTTPGCKTHVCDHVNLNGEKCGLKYHTQQHHNGPCEEFNCKFCKKHRYFIYKPIVITEIRCEYCGAEFDHDSDYCRFKPDIYKKDDSDDSDKCPYCSEDITYDGHHIADCPVKDIFNSQNSSVIKKDSNTNITNKTPGVMYASNNPSSVNYSLTKEKNPHTRNNNSGTINPIAEKQKNNYVKYDYNKDDDTIERELNVQQFRKKTPNRSNYSAVYAFNIFYNLKEKKSYFLACYSNLDGVPGSNFRSKNKFWNQGGHINGRDGILKTLLKESYEQAGIDVSRASQIIQIQLPINDDIQPPIKIDDDGVALFLNIFYENAQKKFPEFDGPQDTSKVIQFYNHELIDMYEQYEYNKGVAWVLIDAIKDRIHKNNRGRYIHPEIGDSYVVKLLIYDIIKKNLLIDYVNQYKSTLS